MVASFYQLLESDNRHLESITKILKTTLRNYMKIFIIFLNVPFKIWKNSVLQSKNLTILQAYDLQRNNYELQNRFIGRNWGRNLEFHLL